MPGKGRALSLRDAVDHVRERSFTTGGGSAGAEVEWVVVDDAVPAERPSLERLKSAVDAASRCRVTFEPGGQLELSSEPGSIGAICESVAADEAAVRASLAQEGISLLGIGMDPHREPSRLVRGPRYDAMETYFDARGPEGRRMMCGTAAIQINIDAGRSEEQIEARWRLAHAAGPMLVAAFANSPLALGAPTGYRSTRMANWWRMDSTRTWPAIGAAGARDDWAAYVLRARVMMMRDGDDFRAVPSPMSFADWIGRGHALGFPTIDDLDYHMTTLFPPVRARGWLELRYLDAQASPWWRAATGIAITLMNDPSAAAVAERATRPSAGMWTQAAQEGLTNPVLATAARECVEAAIDAMSGAGADPATVTAAAQFFDRYTARGRSPADDLLDQFTGRRSSESARVAG